MWWSMNENNCSCSRDYSFTMSALSNLALLYFICVCHQWRKKFHSWNRWPAFRGHLHQAVCYQSLLNYKLHNIYAFVISLVCFQPFVFLSKTLSKHTLTIQAMECTDCMLTLNWLMAFFLYLKFMQRYYFNSFWLFQIILSSWQVDLIHKLFNHFFQQKKV